MQSSHVRPVDKLFPSTALSKAARCRAGDTPERGKYGAQSSMTAAVRLRQLTSCTESKTVNAVWAFGPGLRSKLDEHPHYPHAGLWLGEGGFFAGRGMLWGEETMADRHRPRCFSKNQITTEVGWRPNTENIVTQNIIERNRSPIGLDHLKYASLFQIRGLPCGTHFANLVRRALSLISIVMASIIVRK
jgi:hypothetical protein